MPFSFFEKKVAPAPTLTATEVVQNRWQAFALDHAERYPPLAELVELMPSFPALHALYPFTSVGRLCFSRCTDFPYYVDFIVRPKLVDPRLVNPRLVNPRLVNPKLASLKPVYYAEITLQKGGWAYTRRIGQGSAREALTILEAAVPAGYGPAQLGTADALPPSLMEHD